jgi:glycosyltransferase involved in cell wall biosynthesis
MPKISVIVAVYNTSAFLKRCLSSLLSQTHNDLEVLLIDDGSTDDSPALCDRYAATDQRVRVFHQANAGQSAAKNRGLQMATGDLIGFVDSDDWVVSDTFAYLLGLLETHQADVAEIDHEVAYSDNHEMRQPAERIEVFSEEEILIHYFEHNEFAMGFRLYRRELFSGVLFDVGRINEDVVAGYRALLNANKLVSSNQPKYFYYSNPIGTSESPLRRRDMDLLFAGQQLDVLTAESDNKHLRRLALTKRHRSSFTLLVKMAVFGCSDELDKKTIARELKVQIRQHYGFLMTSNMPVNRKILLTGCRFCYPLVCLAGSIYHALLNLRTRRQVPVA